METIRAGPAGEAIDAPRHRALGSTTRVAILRLIRAAETGTTADEIAAGTGLHPSTVRAHLDRLTEAGLLVRARASGGQPGRPAWRYRAAAPEPAPAPYRALAAALLDEIAEAGAGTAAAAARAGERWGRRLAPADAGDLDPLDVVTGVLAELGFDPGVTAGRAGGAEVHLHTCPFLELVARQPDAMCGVHLGVIRGVLDRAGALAADAVLEPFGAPNACVVRLAATSTGPTEDPA